MHLPINNGTSLGLLLLFWSSLSPAPTVVSFIMEYARRFHSYAHYERAVNPDVKL